MRLSTFSPLHAIVLIAISNVFPTRGSATTADVPSHSLDKALQTCPSRSINYITEGLAQQCLTSSWASKPTSSKSEDRADAVSHADLSTTTSASSVQPNSSRENFSSTADYTPLSDPTSAFSSIHEQSTQKINQGTVTARAENGDESALQEAEGESPLDTANFLSFEDWKRQNLAKAGQSAENFAAKGGSENAEQRRRQGPIHNALDTLGEESEIDLDFTGFVTPGGINEALPVQAAKTERGADEQAGGAAEGEQADLSNVRTRSKDAGKTCKERSNFASFDCAATVLKSNPECKGSTSVLVENKDNYMLNVCSVKNKFFIVELCDAILIDTVVLANFEFFSSMFRTFRVSVSDRYPVKMDKWKVLGTYEAANSRGLQAFLVENPLIWAKYLRIEFLTHYGNEYYCPVSLLRIHGTTMMEEFNHEMKGSKEDDEPEMEPEGADNGRLESAHDTRTSIVPKSTTVDGHMVSAKIESKPDQTSTEVVEGGGSPAPVSAKGGAVFGRPSTCHSPTVFPILGAQYPEMCDVPQDAEQGSPGNSHIRNGDQTASSTSLNRSQDSSHSSTTSLSQRPDLTNTTTKPSSSSFKAIAVTQASDPTSSVPVNPSASGNSRRLSSTTSLATTASSSHSSSQPPSSAQPPPANPTTQESFFKSVHKRLQQLESNSTLSLQYIEEQSRILREAFSKVEKRQLAKTSGFLETLNTTVLTELREFRMQYDQIWQSTVLELSSQRENSQQEVSALYKRLTYLTDEIVFQKRVAVLQFMLILICLGFIIFPRPVTNSAYFEFPPMVQNALNKSSTSLSRTLHFESPPGSPPVTRPSSRYSLFRSWTQKRSPSPDSEVDRGPRSPTIEFSPPTPESLRSLDEQEQSSSAEESRGDHSDGSPVRRQKVAEIRSKSAPPVEEVQTQQALADEVVATPKANTIFHTDLPL